MLKGWRVVGVSVVAIGVMVVTMGFSNSAVSASFAMNSQLTRGNGVSVWVPFGLSSAELSRADLQISYSPLTNQLSGEMVFPGGSYTFTD